MELPWIWFLLLANVAILLLGTVVAVNVHQACYGSDATIDCSQHRLQCQKGTIFFARALRGFKRIADTCSVQRSICQSNKLCCKYNQHDCVEMYTQEAFSTLAMKCWNNKKCTNTVPYAWKTTCGNNIKDGSGYSYLEFLCLSDSSIFDFSDTSSQTVKNIVLNFGTVTSGLFVCEVESSSWFSRTANVLLLRESKSHIPGNCSTMAVKGESWLPYDTFSSRYTQGQFKTPFTVYAVKQNVLDQAWVVIHTLDDEKVKVTCQPWKTDVWFPPCPSDTPSTTTVGSTRESTGSSASHDTTTAAGVQSISTPHGPTGSSPGVPGENKTQAENSSSNTARIVGGVVGAVLLVLLVVALVATLVFLKRRSGHGKTSKVVTWFKGGNSSGNPPASVSSESGRAVSHVTPAQPTSLPAYDNSMAAIADEAGVRVDPGNDYSHLRQKPSSSTACDVTYGHLAHGNDVTDYGYDHVTKGKPAVRSGDVINNVYDTAGPSTGAPSDEDFYNVAGAAKNWPDVINNVYSTPSPATEASSDGDYYNVTGLPQTGRDVIDNVYDTPKPEAAPGLVETEACDVTGINAGSPYELARAVK